MVEIDGVLKEGVKLNCRVCGDVFEVKEYDRNRRKLCDKASCLRSEAARRMREFRATDIGRAAVKKANLAYKRPDREWVCVRCNGKIVSARKKSWCNDCIEWGRKMGYKNPVAVFSMKKYRDSNHEKCGARAKISTTLKKIKRGTLIAEPCVVCGGRENIHHHHHSYRADKAKDVIPLCKPHHHELHSWDSN